MTTMPRRRREAIVAANTTIHPPRAVTLSFPVPRAGEKALARATEAEEARDRARLEATEALERVRRLEATEMARRGRSRWPPGRPYAGGEFQAPAGGTSQQRSCGRVPSCGTILSCVREPDGSETRSAPSLPGGRFGRLNPQQRLVTGSDLSRYRQPPQQYPGHHPGALRLGNWGKAAERTTYRSLWGH
jgi:hypothetical protein